MGEFPLLGLDRSAWDEHYENDLVAIRARSTTDHFSQWFSSTAIPRYHRLIGEKFKAYSTVNPFIQTLP